jgi:hypothetical protein
MASGIIALLVASPPRCDGIVQRDVHHARLGWTAREFTGADTISGGAGARMARDDHVIPVGCQQFMSNRAYATIEKVDAGHLSLISRPEAVTSEIEDAAATTS